MSRVNTVCKVKVYEKDGEEIPIGIDEYITIESHWNNEDMVILTVKDEEVTIIASDLIKAIQRCSR